MAFFCLFVKMRSFHIKYALLSFCEATGAVHASHTPRRSASKACLVTSALHVPCCNTQCSHADDAFNILFTIEAAFRIFALGSVRRYLASPWNAFDFVIVSFGYVGYFLEDNGGSSRVRALRAFRALRPLRAMSRFRSLRTIIDCFITVRTPEIIPSTSTH
jgi:hypothetical protein